MRIHLPAGFAVLLSFSPLAAQAQTVRVAHDQRFPPFAEVKDGKSEGLAVDILRKAQRCERQHQDRAQRPTSQSARNSGRLTPRASG
jgi:hypothetical protein